MTEAERTALRRSLASDPARLAEACRVIAQARIDQRKGWWRAPSPGLATPTTTDRKPPSN